MSNAPRQFTRREMIALSARAGLGFGLAGRAASASDSSTESFSFLVVNDIHYFDRRCGAWLENAIRKMQSHAPKPDFCVIAGDLSERGRREELGAVREISSALGVPLCTLPGNHD